LAFIIDIRRDNALQHLLFKALFTLAPTRIEYLSLLVGRSLPADPESWEDRSLDDIVARVDEVGPDSEAARRARTAVDSVVATFGIPMSQEGLATVARFHGEFIRLGLDLRFTSLGRAPRPYYPTLRRLLLETDLEGRQGSYLATPDGYAFLRDMEMSNRVVPVVGDLAGPHALRAVGDEIRRRGLSVSAFYTSNVEFYLFRSGTFPAFAANTATLPVDDRSVLIRSYFPNVRGLHPLAARGDYSTQLVQSLVGFQERVEGGGYGSYWELVTTGVLGYGPAGGP
jgi:hypothetical protein